MGKIEIDHTGSGGGITLSSDGTSLLLGGTAIGGGGADLYAANESSPSAQPSATGTNAIAIGDSAVASGNDSFAIGDSAVSGGTRSVALGKSRADGQDSFAAAIGTNSSSYGALSTHAIALGDNALVTSTAYHGVAIGELASCRSERSIAVGNYSSVGTNANGSFAGMGTVNNVAANSVAIKGTSSGNSGLAVGRNSVAAGTYAVALSNSRAGSTNAIAMGIYDNTSSYGATAVDSVAIGKQAKATSTNAFSLGTSSQATGSQAYSLGQFGVASATYAYCLGGFSTASGYGSYAIGTSIGATSQYSVAVGRRAKTVIEGQYAFSNEWFSAQGDSQTSTYVLRSDTTDATAEAMVTDGPNETRGTNNQIVLHNNSAFAFHGTIVARESATDGTDCAAWKVEGLIRREGTAATTTLVNSATTVLDNTPSWGMALSADTTNGCLKIEVTGAASTNIRWVATINTSEVTYA